MSKREEIASIELQLDVQGTVSAVEEVSKAVEIVGKLAIDISSSISDVFTSALANIEGLTVDVGILSNSLEFIKKWDLSSVSRELSNISGALGDILEKLKEPDWLTMIDLAMQVYGMRSQGGNGKSRKILFGGYNGKYTAGKGKYESGETILFGKTSGKYSADSSTEMMSIAAGGVGMMDSGLTDAISDITEKFKGSAAATWLQNAATTAWKGISTAATAVTTAFGAAMNFLTSPIGLVVIGITALIAIIVLLIANWDTVKEVAGNVWDWIKSVWNNVAAWFQEKILDPLVNGFKGMVNGIIGFINGMISAVISGINFIIRALNKVSFNVPDWVPGIGGMTIGFSINEIKAPQIPYLAKGAVLPANKPFLAMVGDQKRGTNVEAPLATIQEAVAVVMEDMIASNMAGHETANIGFMKRWLRK